MLKSPEQFNPQDESAEQSPENRIENITEAQKEAYRIRLFALAEKMKKKGINNSAPWSKDWKNIEGKTLAELQPDTEDYQKAATQYEKLFGEGAGKIPKALEWFVKFIIDLRASALAKSEIHMQTQKKKKDGVS